ncbi:MAG: hypothetical protein KDK34_16300, partial [Leptospiraceae bacterium]|nr:hypothetical protein [Leptospiraceae bacterium]
MKRLPILLLLSGFLFTDSNCQNANTDCHGVDCSWLQAYLLYNINTYIATGADTAGCGIFISNDLTNWDSVFRPDSSINCQFLVTMNYKNGFFAVGGSDAGNQCIAFTSSDGINYTQRDCMPIASTAVTDSVYVNNRLWFSTQSTNMRYSDDFGITWQTTTIPGGSGNSLFWDGTAFLVGASGGQIYRANDPADALGGWSNPHTAAGAIFDIVSTPVATLAVGGTTTVALTSNNYFGSVTDVSANVFNGRPGSETPGRAAVFNGTTYVFGGIGFTAGNSCIADHSTDLTNWAGATRIANLCNYTGSGSNQHQAGNLDVLDGVGLFASGASFSGANSEKYVARS